MILAPFNDTDLERSIIAIHRYYPIINAVEYGVPVVVVIRMASLRLSMTRLHP